MHNCANFISLRPDQVKRLSMDQHPQDDQILAKIPRGNHTSACQHLLAAISEIWADGPGAGPSTHVT